MELTLPYDTEMENSVLGSIITRPENYGSIEKYFTNQDVFYQTKAQLLWKRLSKMKKDKEVIDMLTVCSSINSYDQDQGLTKWYISACTKDCSVMPEIYANKLYEKYLMRKLIVKTQEIVMKAKQNSPDVYEVLNDSHTMIGDLINMLSRAVENGNKSIFFSRELPNSELLKKIICLESQQLSYGMLRKNLFTEKAKEMLEQGIKTVRKKYTKDKFLMFDNIKDFSLAANEVKKFKPDIIFDDYIQLITYNGKEDQRRLQIENLVNNYKWLAKEMNCVVVLASQLNRGIESRGKNYEPHLSDLAESGAIEQVAENVFFSFYDYKVKGEAGKGKNILTISAGKVRYGDTGKIDLGYDGDKCKVYNSMEEMTDGTIPF
jgi:replicative DNA helicase